MAAEENGIRSKIKVKVLEQQEVVEVKTVEGNNDKGKEASDAHCPGAWFQSLHPQCRGRCSCMVICFGSGNIS